MELEEDEEDLRIVDSDSEGEVCVCLYVCGVSEGGKEGECVCICVYVSTLGPLYPVFHLTADTK